MSTYRARGCAYADEFGIAQVVTSLPDLFAASIDAVYMSTTNVRHRAAEAGIHVLCEKPLARCLSDAREVVACERAGGHSDQSSSPQRCDRAGDARDDPHWPHRPPARRSSRPRWLSAGASARVATEGSSAGAGAILDLTVHDADLLRFILDDEPEAVAIFSQNGGLAAPGIEDAVASLIRFRSCLLAQLFEGFTKRYAETGVKVHGSLGSLLARDCMSQTPRGALVLRRVAGEEHNYYVRGVRSFHDAIAGREAGSERRASDHWRLRSARWSTLELGAPCGSTRALRWAEPGHNAEGEQTMRKFQEGATMQVAMVVRDMKAAMKRHWDIFKIGPWDIYTFDATKVQNYVYRGEPATHSCLIAVTLSGDTQLELIQPVTGYSIYDEHLRKHGEGLHHIKLYYANCKKAVADFTSRGYPVIQSGRFDEDEHYYLDTETDYGYIIELGNAGKIPSAESRYPA